MSSSSCIWLFGLSIVFLRFIHVGACIRIHSFSWLNNSPLFGYITFSLSIHHLMEIWVVYSFWLLRIKLLWTFTYKSLYVYMFSFPLGIYLGEGYLNGMIGRYLTFKKLRNCLKWFSHYAFPLAVYESFSYVFINTWYSQSFYLTILRIIMISNCGLIWFP